MSSPRARVRVGTFDLPRVARQNGLFRRFCRGGVGKNESPPKEIILDFWQEASKPDFMQTTAS